MERVQRKRFFNNESSDQLPISVEPIRRMPVGRSRSFHSSSDFESDYRRHHQAIDIQRYGLPTYQVGAYKQRRRRLTLLVTVAVFLMIGAIGACFYERVNELHAQEINDQLEKVRKLEQRVKAQQTEINDFKNKLEKYDGAGLSKLFHLEHYRLQMHQGIQLLSKRLVEEK